jgi:hypothetical protein
MDWKELRPNFNARGYLRDKHYTDEALEAVLQLDALILPGMPEEGGRLLSQGSAAELFLSSASDVRKLLERGGVRAALVQDPTLARREIVRKAADVFLPVIVLLQQGALPIALGVLANWIWHRFGEPSGENTEGDNILVEIVEMKTPDVCFRRLSFKGPANRLVELLRAEADRAIEQSER